MGERVCPWWMGPLLLNPLRAWGTRPERLLRPYVREGMRVLEPGPGMGFFTLPLARMVGASGRVIAVDVQPRMLDGLTQRVRRAGLEERVETRLAERNALGVGDLPGSIDFVLAFAVVHEMPSADAFFRTAAAVLKPGGFLLLAEPAGHVKSAKFAMELEAARRAGLAEVDSPAIRRSHAALLQRGRA